MWWWRASRVKYARHHRLGHLAPIASCNLPQRAIKGPLIFQWIRLCYPKKIRIFHENIAACNYFWMRMSTYSRTSTAVHNYYRKNCKMAALTPALITINNKSQNVSLGCRNTYVYTICVSAKGLSTDVQAKYGLRGQTGPRDGAADRPGGWTGRAAARRPPLLRLDHLQLMLSFVIGMARAW